MKIACIGCGVYSLGITSLLKENQKNEIWIWTHEESLIPEIQEKTNALNVFVSHDLKKVVEKAKAIFLLTSSNFYEQTITQLKPYLDEHSRIYIGTKGMIQNEFLLSKTKELLNVENCYVFAGPTLAKDIEQNHPVGFTVSPMDHQVFASMMPLSIDVDYTNDATFLEFFTIYKNIIAIASGILSSSLNSYSTTISFLKKAYLEAMERIFPNNHEILYGTMGDFFLTGTMNHSRNFTYGTLLESNPKKAKLFLKENTVEGYAMLPQLYHYLQNQKISLKIIEILYSIIYQNQDTSLLLDYLNRKTDRT